MFYPFFDIEDTHTKSQYTVLSDDIRIGNSDERKETIHRIQIFDV